jgi:hypothetical protein
MGCGFARERTIEMIVVPFMVLNDPAGPICKPLITIKSLLRAGALPRFQALWGRSQGGDCHAVASALMAGRMIRACTHKSSSSVRFRAKQTLEPTSPNDRV